MAYSFRDWFAPRRAETKQALLESTAYAHSFMHQPGKPVWMRRDYGRFAEEAYARNVIAHRAIDLVASGVASINWRER